MSRRRAINWFLFNWKRLAKNNFIDRLQFASTRLQQRRSCRLSSYPLVDNVVQRECFPYQLFQLYKVHLTLDWLFELLQQQRLSRYKHQYILLHVKSTYSTFTNDLFVWFISDEKNLFDFRTLEKCSWDSQKTVEWLRR